MATQSFDSNHNQWVSMRIAVSHDVTLDKVMYVGHCTNDREWRALCFYCVERRNAAPAYLEGITGPRTMELEFLVDLKPELDVVDNIMFKKYKVLIGQCEDCGSVYYADFEIIKEKRDE